MTDIRYSAYRDGEYITIPPIDELCLVLKDKFMRQEEKIEYYKKSMKKQYNEMNENYQRGFPISKEESEKINAWINKHEKEKHSYSENGSPRGGAIGGCYCYTFIPTSIGVFGSIKCSCGEKFTFQEEA